MPEVTGSCLCRALKLTISQPPTATGTETVSPQIKAACYCLDCRKGSGGPQQTNAVFNTEQVTLHDLQSKAKTYTVTRTASGKPKDKVFCGECGCTMFTRPMAHEGRVTIVKIGIIDGDKDLWPPNVEIFVRDRPAYCLPIADAVQVEGMPGP